MKTVGFIGLGVMGQSMAGHLAKKLPAEAERKLLVFDIDKTKMDSMTAASANTASVKIHPASGVAEIGRQADIVFLSLPASQVVREVILGKDGLAEFLKPGSIVADTSTTEVEIVKTAAAELEKKGVDFIDTPVSGGDKAAREGTLSFMAGGKRNVFNALKPYCAAMAASVVYMGGTGAGQTAKAVNQIIVAATFAAIAESFSMGVKNGLDPKTLYEAIKGGWAGSKLLDVAVQDMFSREFKPGGTVDIFWKDLGCALALSKNTDAPVPVTALVHEIFKAARAKGEGKKSQTAIVRLWEDLLGMEVR
ncbi:MAG: NAD(P)-binding domain-containing protein [Treponema sp.]|nr:NAD(P)-binding domain-containing protein [Treponema sp.]